MIKLIFSAIVLATALQAKAQLEVPPQWKFQKMITPHFEIIHNASQQELAQLYAEKLEQSHQALSQVFSILPEKTTVVINDKTDSTNGYATRLPYPHIMAYPVLPESDSSLGDAGDWTLEFLGHEYTHILNFEPATGVMGGLRYVFGSILAPNLLLPTWWKEGLAVHLETTLGHGGRLRSPYQDALLRAWSLESQLFTYDVSRANEVLPFWPRGMTPYIFGSLFWAQTSLEHGNKIVDLLNLHHSRRVPYLLNSVAETHLGTSYSLQYQKALTYTQQQIDRQLSELRREQPTVTQKQLFTASYSMQPAFSSDGEYLAMITVDKKDDRWLQIFKKEDLEKQDRGAAQPIYSFKHEVQNLTWFHHSQKVLFDKLKAINRYETRSDLWIADLETKKITPLTKGLRAREAHLSSDDKQIVFVQLLAGQHQISILDIETKNIKKVYRGELGERLASPLFWNDNEVIFTSRRTNGKETLLKVILSEGEPEKILTDFTSPRSARKEQGALYFSSSTNGIPNIYVSMDLKSARPLTHTLTSLTQFAVEPQTQDLWATEMTAQGPQIVQITFENQRSSNSALPSTKSLFNSLYPEKNPPSLTSNPSSSNPSLPTELEPYSPWGYLIPRYWMPFISGSTNGGLVFQASTSSFDPLKKHSYTLDANYDTITQEISTTGQYLNQTSTLPFMITASKLSSYLGSSNYILTDNMLSAALLPDTFDLSENSRLQVGWQYIERKSDFTNVKRAGPYALFSFDSLSQGGHEIAPTRSQTAYLGWTSYLPGSREYLAHNRYLVGWSLYTDRFLPERHALSMKFNAVHTPEKISANYGVQTESVFLFPTLNFPTYVMRGYTTGQFFGKNLAVANFDYQLPLKDMYSGSGTDPIFFKRLSMALTFDAIALDGFVINSITGSRKSTTTHRQYTSFGAEARGDLTLGYLIPLRLVFGYYLTPQSPEKSPGAAALSFQMAMP